MMSLVLAESSLELVPAELRRHPSVASHAGREGRSAGEMLLDNSWHFAAMRGIADEIRRGRPDLVHFAILEATGTPLYREDGLRLYVHTISDTVIEFGRGVRVPRSYRRFAGLAAGLLRDGRAGPPGGALLEARRQTFSQLLREISPARTVGLSTLGEERTFGGIASRIDDGCCAVVGGFQKGHFSPRVSENLDELYSAGAPLEGHVAVARLLYECEKTVFM